MTADKVDSTAPAERATVAPSPSDPYLSTVKVARMFDVTTETVRKWIEAGKIPGAQINGRWKILSSEATKFANEKYGST